MAETGHRHIESLVKKAARTEVSGLFRNGMRGSPSWPGSVHDGPIQRSDTLAQSCPRHSRRHLHHRGGPYIFDESACTLCSCSGLIQIDTSMRDNKAA